MRHNNHKSKFYRLIPLTAILTFGSFLIVACGPPPQQYLRTYSPPSKRYTASYDISLERVERPEKVEKHYGKPKIEPIEESGETKYQFQDEMIKISWTVEPTGIAFALDNKTSHSIRIIWNEAAFVDEKGLSHKLIHSGVKYVDRNKPQPPTVVVRKGTIKDVIIPTHLVESKNYNAARLPVGLQKEPLFPASATGQTSFVLESKVKPYIGKKFEILLPLKIEDVMNDYIFSFRIHNIEVTPKDSMSSSERKVLSEFRNACKEKDERFCMLPNAIVFDSRTNLEWKAGPDKTTTWNEARMWTENLGNGWRMPTLEELKTLYQEGLGLRNMTPLLKISEHYVWSSQYEYFQAEGRYNKAAFSFYDGYFVIGVPSPFYRALAVRSETGR